jgi:hypothetical protein
MKLENSEGTWMIYNAKNPSHTTSRAYIIKFHPSSIAEKGPVLSYILLQRSYRKYIEHSAVSFDGFKPYEPKAEDLHEAVQAIFDPSSIRL